MNQLLDDRVLSVFKGRQILITGCTGYISANLIQLLSTIDCRIIGVSRLGVSSPSPELEKAKFEFVNGDMSEDRFWENILAGVDFVFPLGAQTSVYVANDDAKADLRANIYPLINLLETCRKKSWKPTIVFSGAATQIGIPASLPVTEDMPDKPLTIYDVHKIFAEHYLEFYSQFGYVKATSLRLANVYGPGPKNGSADRGILNLMVRRALNEEPLTIYGNGEFLRDYVYVTDVARAFLYAAANIDNCSGKYFYIGSGEARTLASAIQMVAELVNKKTGNKVIVNSVPPPANLSPIEARNFVSNGEKFKTASNWESKVSFSEGVNLTIEHWIKEKVKI